MTDPAESDRLEEQSRRNTQFIDVCVVDANSTTRSQTAKRLGLELDFMVRQFSNADDVSGSVAPSKSFVCVIHEPEFADHIEEYVSLRKRLSQGLLLLLHQPSAAILAKSIRAGFRGYYAENVESYNLVYAIRAVHSGAIWISGDAHVSLEQVANSFSESSTRRQTAELTEREKLVLKHIADGLSNREIATRLFVSIATIKSTLRGLFRKLEVNDRTQAAVRASQHGIIQKDT